MDNNHFILSVNYGTVNPMAWTLWRYSDGENKGWHIVDSYYYNSRESGYCLKDADYADTIMLALLTEIENIPQHLYESTKFHCDILIEKGLFGFINTLLERSTKYPFTFSVKEFVPIHVLESKIKQQNNLWQFMIDLCHHYSEMPICHMDKEDERMIESIILAIYYINNYCSEKFNNRNRATIKRRYK